MGYKMHVYFHLSLLVIHVINLLKKQKIKRYKRTIKSTLRSSRDSIIKEKV